MKTPVPSRRAIVVLAWVVVVVVLLAFVWLTGKVTSLNEQSRGFEQRDEQSLSDRQELRERLDREEAAMQALAEQLRQLGEKPVVEPDDPPDPGQVVVVPGPKGDRGESCIEEIGLQPCRGDEGRTGEPGSEGEAGEPGVPGAQGEPGPKGDKGDTGSQGPKGDPGTAQPGTYSCAAGEYMTGFSITDAGTVVLVCQPVLGPGNPNEGARR